MRVWRGAIQRRRRTARLASGSRAATYARQQAWDRIGRYLRKDWRFVAGVIALPPCAVVPVTVHQYEGPARWFIVGFSVASGLWAAAMVTVLFSGAAGTIMGVLAESWTADTFRELSKPGWRVVNGVRLRRQADIDHVAVGPAGILVVETKWTSVRSSLRAPSAELARSLERWIKQVTGNASDLRQALQPRRARCTRAGGPPALSPGNARD
ncbi:MAG: nuclease-related domain-containing protein [Acidimicrobiia bacterium]